MQPPIWTFVASRIALSQFETEAGVLLVLLMKFKTNYPHTLTSIYPHIQITPPPTCTTKWKDFREDIWPGTEVGGRTNIAYVFLSSPDHVDDTLPVHVQYATFHESLQLLSVFRIEPKLLYLSGRRMVSQLFIRAKLTKFHEIIMPRFGWLTVLPFNTPWNCWDCLLSLSLVITNRLND